MMTGVSKGGYQAVGPEDTLTRSQALAGRGYAPEVVARTQQRL